MQTVRLRVNDRVYEKVLWLLSKFNKDEIEVIQETDDFVNNSNYLAKELNEIITGQAKFIEIDETEKRLEAIIKKYQN